MTGVTAVWLEPFPTPDLDPAGIVAGRAGLRLALVAALPCFHLDSEPC